MMVILLKLFWTVYLRQIGAKGIKRSPFMALRRTGSRQIWLSRRSECTSPYYLLSSRRVQGKMNFNASSAQVACACNAFSATLDHTLISDHLSALTVQIAVRASAFFCCSHSAVIKPSLETRIVQQVWKVYMSMFERRRPESCRAVSGKST